MASSALEPGRVVAGRYRVESKIGEGGMGAVYLVRHVHTDEMLALKLLHPQVLRDEAAVARFRQEARAPAKIASEHVARVTDADTAPDLEDAPFYVMEYLRGRDLDAMLQAEGPLPVHAAVEYLHQAARALDKAHAMGIVHRDLKPENLFLTHREDGSPCIKLLDFGIARLGDNDAPSKMNTAAGFIFGTPSYMAPEQATGSVELIGPPTDVWAFGLVTFKLLVGQDFWDSQNLQQLYAKILAEPIPAPSARGSTLGAGFDAWFARCVAREVGARFKTTGEAAGALAEALGIRIERPRFSSASFPSAVPSEGSIKIVLPPPAEASASDVPVAPRRSKAPLFVGAGVSLLLFVAGGAVAIERATRKPVGIVATASTASIPAAVLAPSASVAEPASSNASPDETAPPNAEPTAASEPARPRATGGGGAATKPSAAAATSTGQALSKEQRRRLDALERLCAQGTFNAAECKAKRAAIMRGGP
ncbi:MAG: protein kinase [Labilithrix sp.]|nr:protein kinase [Labilithrix sp.]